jgi:hypothetical protein
MLAREEYETLLPQLVHEEWQQQVSFQPRISPSISIVFYMVCVRGGEGEMETHGTDGPHLVISALASSAVVMSEASLGFKVSSCNNVVADAPILAVPTVSSTKESPSNFSENRCNEYGFHTSHIPCTHWMNVYHTRT